MAVQEYLLGLLAFGLTISLSLGLKQSHTTHCPNNTNLIIRWFPSFPYASVNTSSADRNPLDDGLLLLVLEQIRTNCCPSLNTSLQYLDIKSSNGIENHMENSSADDSLTFYFPVFAPKKSTVIFDEEYLFIRVELSPGPAVIAPIVSIDRRSNVIKAVSSSWGFLLLILIMAGICGMTIWLLEVRSNDQEFPVRFFKGAWEGFWWSMVTMTTVGYGDRAPVSILGRVFAMLWMLCGTIIMSIFTAHLTTSLTSHEMAIKEDHYIGKKIGVNLGTKYYYEEEYNIGAEFIEFSDTLLFIEAVKKSRITKGFIDNYLMAKYIFKVHKDIVDGLKIEKVFQKPLEIGFGVTGELDQDDYPEEAEKNHLFYKCVKKTSGPITSMFMAELSHDYEESAEDDESSSLSSKELLSWMVILTMVFCGLFTLGVSFEVYHYIKTRKPPGSNDDMEMYTNENKDRQETFDRQ